MVAVQVQKVFLAVWLCSCFAIISCTGVSVHECYSASAVCCDGEMSIGEVEWLVNNTALGTKAYNISTYLYKDNFRSYLNLSTCFGKVKQVQVSCCPLDEEDFHVITCKNYTWINPNFRDRRSGNIVVKVIPAVVVGVLILVVALAIALPCCFKNSNVIMNWRKGYKPIDDEGFKYIWPKLSGIAHEWEQVAVEFPQLIDVEQIRQKYHSDEKRMKEVIRIALCDCSGTQWDRLVCLFHGIDREIAEQICREKCPDQEYDVIVKEYNAPIETSTVGTQSSSQDMIDDTEHEKPAASLVGQETEPTHPELATGKSGSTEQIKEQQRGKFTRASTNMLHHSGTAVTYADVHRESGRLALETDESYQPKAAVSRAEGTFLTGEDPHDASAVVQFSTPEIVQQTAQIDSSEKQEPPACVSGASVSDAGSSTDDPNELQPLQGAASPPSLEEEDRDSETRL